MSSLPLETPANSSCSWAYLGSSCVSKYRLGNKCLNHVVIVMRLLEGDTISAKPHDNMARRSLNHMECLLSGEQCNISGWDELRKYPNWGLTTPVL